uniref:Protein kinase domain-containing protein n=1 Tax=Glossina brevipalpis TaxID=37001 RepID=A0A1A9W4R9_9MUSC
MKCHGNEHSGISTSTTTKPTKPSLAPHNSAQERERRLMNVLAARRSALHRAGVRSRIITTSRTATAVETTSRTPTDPRSVCIRNCTKNFTRRTTASCMRQCANFSRVGNSTLAISNTSMKTLKAGSSNNQQNEKDTNEILFTDESSHGVLVIAKEQNDTLNHIPDEKKSGSGIKSRGNRRKSAMNAITLSTTSIEDDEIQPYLYFGQKLPPLKPNALTITSVSDEHPKLLEVSVAKNLPQLPITVTTTPVNLASTSTLSAVERSRARFKYNMRGGVSFNRRYSAIGRTPTVELRSSNVSNIKETLKHTTPIVFTSTTLEPLTMKNENTTTSKLVRQSSTPLIITVLGDDEFTTMTPYTNNSPYEAKISTLPLTAGFNTSNALVTSTIPSIIVTSAISTIATKTTTTHAPTTRATIMTTTATTTIPTTTTATKLPQNTTTSMTSNTIADSILSTQPILEISSSTKKANIIEEDTELLRALGPSLTESINTDDKTNLIIFVNRTSGVYIPAPITSTTLRPQRQDGFDAITTDSSPTVLRTTVLTSVRSTVNPRTKEQFIKSTENPMDHFYRPFGMANNVAGVTESWITSTPQQVTGEISSTVVTNDQEISAEMQRMNIVTMVLAGIGIIPLIAIILYLVRNYIMKRPLKDDEDFDVCITDQQPISPVKKLDSKYHINDDKNDDEVDHRKLPQRQHSQVHKLPSRDIKIHNPNTVHQRHYNDDKSSITSDQEFDRSNIRLKSLLGEGNFGQVWKAEADDLSGHFGATRIVAVKTIRACSTQVSLKDEANIMRKLGSHPNVVTLLGACVETEPHMLIMEYAMRGRLLSLLRAARNATNILPASVPGGRSQTPLSPRTLAGFCLDISCGMEYIAEKRIVHRDLAARNVLLDHNGVCKICDFGMSIDLDAERKRKELEKNCANEIMRSNFNKFKFDFGGKFIMNHWPPNPQKEGNMSEVKKGHGHDTIGRRPALPIRWMAPEALQYHVFTRETDIWAFGIVLWEIATLGSTPYSHLTGREVIRRVPQGLRPDLPKEGRHEFYNLMSRCWHKDPQMRPSFSQARLEITRSLHKWVDDDSASNSDYMDVSGFSEDLEHGMVYFNHRISEFECEI